MLIVLLAVLLNAWPYWPLLGTVWVALAAAAAMWPPAERWDEGTPSYKQAKMAKLLRRPMFASLVVWRLGPAPGCELQAKANPPPTWWSPLAHSAIAASIAAAGSVTLDLAVSYALSSNAVPSLALDSLRLDSSSRIPAVTAPLSGVFGWWAVQSVAFVGRVTLYDGKEEGSETYGIPPAGVMQSGLGSFFHSVARHKGFLPIVGAALVLCMAVIWTGVPAAIIGFPLSFTLIGIGALAGVVSAPMRAESERQHEEWRELKHEERQWTLRWAGAKGLALNEWSAPKLAVTANRPDDDNPTYRTLVFRLRAGTQFRDFASASKQIASAIGAQRLFIDRHQRARGQEHLQAFSLSYELADLGDRPHLDHRLDEDTMSFAVRWAVITAFLQLGLHTPMLISADRLTEDGAPQVVQTVWKLMDGDAYTDVAKKTQHLQELLNCDWCRPYVSEGYVGVIFGVRPDTTQFRRPHEAHLRRLRSIDWSYLMRATYIVGSDGKSPELKEASQAQMGLTELIFTYPPAVDSKLISTKLESLRSLSGYGHIEMADHPSDPGAFVLLVGDSDPLEGLYMFKDYQDQILREPTWGEPYTDWAVGITANGTLARYKWDGEEPHLLVAGSSGSGKSGIINSMLCQLMHNNHPDDVRIWLVEPKNELQVYAGIDHVTRFLDFYVTEENLYQTFGTLMEEAVQEMKRRYTAFSLHPQNPQKLSEARDMARADPEGSGHMNFPYLFIIVEECSNYFGKTLKQDKDAQDRIMVHVMKLAREARAAGIHLVVATQHPNKDNIPTTLKAQCRRIGLSTTTVSASMVIIDRPGLEKIKGPGKGLISEGKKQTAFRGLLMERSEDQHARVDDRGDIIAQLPVGDVWPKLPEGVRPAPIVTVRGEGQLLASPVVHLGRMRSAPKAAADYQFRDASAPLNGESPPNKEAAEAPDDDNGLVKSLRKVARAFIP